MIYAVVIIHEESIDKETHINFEFSSEEKRNTAFEKTKDNYSAFEEYEFGEDFFSFKNQNKGCKTTHRKIEIKENDSSRYRA